MAFLRKREWDPIRGLLDIQEEINKLFDSSLSRWPAGKDFAFSPAVDVYEDDSNFYVEADLPGLDPKDIKLSLESGILTIRGKKEQKQEEKKANYYRLERFSGEFYRQVAFPSNVDTSKIKATYKNGVLKITLPKTEETKGKEIKIDVE